MLIQHSPRPHLIYSLYQKLGEPCNQCGRRFKADEEGKKKKVAHLDWHFRVNQGMVKAAEYGQNRDWYIDELVSTFCYLDFTHLIESRLGLSGVKSKKTKSKALRIQSMVQGQIAL